MLSRFELHITVWNNFLARSVAYHPFMVFCTFHCSFSQFIIVQSRKNHNLNSSNNSEIILSENFEIVLIITYELEEPLEIL